MRIYLPYAGRYVGARARAVLAESAEPRRRKMRRQMLRQPVPGRRENRQKTLAGLRLELRAGGGQTRNRRSRCFGGVEFGFLPVRAGTIGVIGAVLEDGNE